MKKRLYSEYFAWIILAFVVFFYCVNLKLLAVLLYIIWYLLFGMVGLAFVLSTMRKIKVSNFFLKISIPATLLPFRKAFYYWTKAVNIILADSTHVSQSYEIIGKVNPDNLYTDNNRSMFYTFVAALLFELDNKEEALRYIETAQRLPHKKMHDETIEKLKNEIMG